MAEITNLGYVVFGVSDLKRWESFAVELLGLKVSRRDEGRLLALRMDAYEQRVLLEQGEDDDLRVAGWEFDSEDDLDSYANELKLRGIEVSTLNTEEAKNRKVEKAYSCEDPNGFRHEFYYGPRLASKENPFNSSVLIGKGFKTGALGLGHILPRSINYKDSVEFYRNKLGLKLSDYIREEVAPGMVVDATFFHTRTGRHHSLATAFIPTDKILNHFMIELESMDDVGLAYDRCLNAGCDIVLGLGHHPNDEMFSFYVNTPSGFAVEYGWGGVVIERDNWQVRSFNKLSDWGHKRSFSKQV